MGDEILISLSVLVLIAYGLFVWEFARDPWWRSMLGQSLMVLAFAIILFQLLAVAVQAFGPDYWGRDWFVGVARSLVLIAGLQRWYVLRKARRSDVHR